MLDALAAAITPPTHSWRPPSLSADLALIFDRGLMADPGWPPGRVLEPDFSGGLWQWPGCGPVAGRAGVVRAGVPGAALADLPATAPKPAHGAKRSTPLWPA